MKRDPIQATVYQVCKKLKSEREKNGISQQRLSQLAGISRTGLRHIESLDTNPTLYSVLKIAHALGINPRDLLES